MKITRFSKLTQSELILLEHSMSFNYVNTTNFEKLKNEVSTQIQLNNFEKSQFENKKRIEELEKELTEIKKRLNK